MTTLTSDSTFAVGDASVAQEEVTLLILPVAGTGEGRGRLVHPSLGAYDYPYSPDEWTNIDGDVIIKPLWAVSKTLRGSANTLFVGNIRDVEVTERWTSEIPGSLGFLRTLLSFWMNPPDPTVAYVEWYPSYTSDLGYKVLMLDVAVGGEGITLDYITRQGYVHGDIALKMRIAGRV